MLECVDVPDIKRIVDRLNSQSEDLPGFTVVRANTETLILQSSKTGLHFFEVGLTIKFPFIAHSRGWSAEDMENNQAYVQQSEALRASAGDLGRRCLNEAALLLGQSALA